ncbi:MAG: hypothetical protein WDN25_03865 [Acetobacteraceae bacterium]
MRDRAAEVDAAYVLRRLDEAGKTLMALPGRGVFPTGFRSSMPDYLHLPDEDFWHAGVNPHLSATQAEHQRPAPPSRAAVSAMDEVYFRWMPLLPSDTEMALRKRRLLLLRSLVWPGSGWDDPHVWSWRRLGEHFRIDHKTAQTWHARVVDQLASRLRRMPDPCAATLARITAHRGRSAGRDHEIPHLQNRFPTPA